MAKVILRNKKNAGSISTPDFNTSYGATGMLLAQNQTSTQLEQTGRHRYKHTSINKADITAADTCF